MITLDQGGAGAELARLLPPPRGLRRRIEGLWVERPLAADVPKRRSWRIVPDHCGHLLYHRVGDGSRLSLVGPRASFVDVRKGRRSFTVGVRLRPWAVGAFFGDSPAMMRDRTLSVDDVLGREGRELKERLDGLPEEAVLPAVVAWLGRRSRVEARPSEDRARGASLSLAELSSCGEAAHSLGISPRALRGLMGDHVGLPPKTYARIVRLHRALGRAQGDESWAGIAVASGYYDQAHMIREFRSLLGESPEVWRRRATSPSTTPPAAPGKPSTPGASSPAVPPPPSSSPRPRR